MRRSKEGFSLVEVIVAIAILAILTMPILAYFTNAAVSTNRGKSAQKATMAAQSVLEELNSCTSFEQIEEQLKAATGSAWTVDSVGTDKSELTKLVTVDGSEYQAKVTVDFDYRTTDAGGTKLTESQYNNYAKPELTEVYSPDSVVAAESDETDTALSNFYYEAYKNNPFITKEQIRAAMSRTLCLDVAKDGDLYLVKGYYRYGYDGKTYEAVMENTKIERDKLKNIYLFYDLMREDIVNEAVEINLNGLSMDEAKNLSVFFVCQNGAISRPTGYSMSMTGSGNFAQIKYYTNGIPSTTTAVETEIVKHATGKRIAAVTVDVYDKDETAYTEESRLARLETSKGE